MNSFLLQAHSCVEKAAMISFVKIHQLDVDNKFSLRGSTLEEAIEVNWKYFCGNLRDKTIDLDSFSFPGR